MHTARVRDFPSWREKARRFIAAGVPPSEIFWADARTPDVFGAPADAFDGSGNDSASEQGARSSISGSWRGVSGGRRSVGGGDGNNVSSRGEGSSVNGHGSSGDGSSDGSSGDGSSSDGSSSGGGRGGGSGSGGDGSSRDGSSVNGDGSSGDGSGGGSSSVGGGSVGGAADGVTSGGTEGAAHRATSERGTGVAEARETGGHALRISRTLLGLLEDLALYRDPGRWELMYRLTWRVLHENRGLLENHADADVQLARDWSKAVHRDIHKMHAFVRFHETDTSDGEKHYVAWFEPEHEILRQVAPFFEQRFPNMKWTIATPDGAAFWNGSHTEFAESPAQANVRRSDDTHDLWRTYYRSICNVARINPRVMRREMPERYWRHLPEATEIDALVRDSKSTHDALLAAAGSAEDMRVPQAVSRQLEKIRIPTESLQACRRCDLWRHATQAVAGEGPPDAAIMLVGEQPGDEEDLRGRVFTGPAGRLLDGLLKDANLNRSDLYITNAVKHFKWEPRGKRRLHRRPDRHEVQACAPWLEHEIESVAPRVIVALGATAIRAVTGATFSVEQARTTRLRHAGGAAVIATYHPSAILRAEDDRKLALSRALTEDLRAARDHLAAASNSATSRGGAAMRHAR